LPEAAKALDQRLRAELGAPDVRYLLVARAKTGEGALERSEAPEASLAGQQAAGALGGFETPSRYLPSLRTQEARRAALPDPATLARNLHLARARSAVCEGTVARLL